MVKNAGDEHITTAGLMDHIVTRMAMCGTTRAATEKRPTKAQFFRKTPAISRILRIQPRLEWMIEQLIRWCLRPASTSMKYLQTSPYPIDVMCVLYIVDFDVP